MCTAEMLCLAELSVRMAEMERKAEIQLPVMRMVLQAHQAAEIPQKHITIRAKSVQRFRKKSKRQRKILL